MLCKQSSLLSCPMVHTLLFFPLHIVEVAKTSSQKQIYKKNSHLAIHRAETKTNRDMIHDGNISRDVLLFYNIAEIRLHLKI